MPFLPDFTFTLVELIISVSLGLFALIATIVSGLWYWGLDHKAESYDKQLRNEIEDDDAFSGIRATARPKLIATSNSTSSRLVSGVKQTIGQRSGKPDKIVALEGDTLEDRKVEMIRERVRDVPGKNILARNLVATLRNYYAYKLALSSEDVSSEVVEHFKARLNEYDYAGKVDELAKSEHYTDIALTVDESSEMDKDTLNDVFLRLVRATELYCVGPISDVNEKHEEIKRCQEYLMLSFFALWTQYLKGAEVPADMAADDCLPIYRADIRDEDNWGYWLLPEDTCDADEFDRVRHIGWSMNNIIDDYWEKGSYSLFHPHGDSIIKMEQVETPFLLIMKDEEEFRGGGFSSSN